MIRWALFCFNFTLRLSYVVVCQQMSVVVRSSIVDRGGLPASCLGCSFVALGTDTTCCAVTAEVCNASMVYNTFTSKTVSGRERVVHRQELWTRPFILEKLHQMCLLKTRKWVFAALIRNSDGTGRKVSICFYPHKYTPHTQGPVFTIANARHRENWRAQHGLAELDKHICGNAEFW